MMPAGKKRWRIASGIPGPLPFNGVEPAWAPTGALIAFIMSRSLYVARPDGSGLRLLLTSHRDLGGLDDPSWSPDGSRIFFLQWEVGPVQLILLSIRPDGSDLRAESKPDWSGASVGGVWSPDRLRRAFVSFASGVGQLIVVDADGTQLHQVSADSPWAVESPSWSPDGTMIAFLRLPPNRSVNPSPPDLFVVNADGTDERRLTATPSIDEEHPGWRAGIHDGFGPCPAS